MKCFLENELNVIGIVDSHGAVHSESKNILDNNTLMHGDYWPCILFNRWRWTEYDGINSLRGDELDIETLDKINTHLRKIYKIKSV